jgi:hypothetical protein
VAAGSERRQPLDMDAEQPGERARLGFAELGELGGRLLDRAVTLAQLDRVAARDRTRGRCVAVGRHRVGKRLDPCRRVTSGRTDRLGIAFLEPMASCVRETVDSSRASHVHEVPERIDSQRRVGVRERSVPARGRDVVPGRAAPASMTPRHSVNGDLISGLERRHVPADTGRGQLKALGELGRGDRAVDDDETKDLLMSTGLGGIHHRVSRGRQHDCGAHLSSLRRAPLWKPGGSRLYRQHHRC